MNITIHFCLAKLSLQIPPVTGLFQITALAQDGPMSLHLLGKRTAISIHFAKSTTIYHHHLCSFLQHVY